jgi:hypothetical protein
MMGTTHFLPIVSSYALAPFPKQATDNSQDNKPDKHTVRTRLHWIITSHPQANPSRSTLKRVNEFLMSHNYSTYRTASINL